jgi:hypothetical protein
MKWEKKFDPKGKDLMIFGHDDVAQMEKFFKDAGYEMKDGLKYGTERADPVFGTRIAFPARIIFLNNKSKES